MPGNNAADTPTTSAAISQQTPSRSMIYTPFIFLLAACPTHKCAWKEHVKQLCNVHWAGHRGRCAALPTHKSNYAHHCPGASCSSARRSGDDGVSGARRVPPVLLTNVHGRATVAGAQPFPHKYEPRSPFHTHTHNIAGVYSGPAHFFQHFSAIRVPLPPQLQWFSADGEKLEFPCGD